MNVKGILAKPELWVHFFFPSPPIGARGKKPRREREIDERLFLLLLLLSAKAAAPKLKGGGKNKSGVILCGKEEEEAAANFEKTPPPWGGSGETSKHCQQTWPPNLLNLNLLNTWKNSQFFHDFFREKKDKVEAARNWNFSHQTRGTFFYLESV